MLHKSLRSWPGAAHDACKCIIWWSQCTYLSIFVRAALTAVSGLRRHERSVGWSNGRQTFHNWTQVSYKNSQKCTLQHLQSLTPSYFSPSLYYSLLHLFPPLCLIILLPSSLSLSHSLSSNTSIIGPLIGSLLTSSDNTLSNILMASCLIWLKKRVNYTVVTASPIPAHWRECKDQNWLDWATVEPLIISYWD